MTGIPPKDTFTVAVQASHAEHCAGPNVAFASIGPDGVAQLARLYLMARLSAPAGGEEIRAMPVEGGGGVSVKWYESLSAETADGADAKLFLSLNGECEGEEDSLLETDSDTRMIVSPTSFGFYLDGSMEEAETSRIHWSHVPGLKEAVEHAIQKASTRMGQGFFQNQSFFQDQSLPQFDWHAQMLREDEANGVIPSLPSWMKASERQESKAEKPQAASSEANLLPVGTQIVSVDGEYGAGGQDGEDTHTGANADGRIVDIEDKTYIVQFGDTTVNLYAADVAEGLKDGRYRALAGEKADEKKPDGGRPVGFPLGTKVCSLHGESMEFDDGSPDLHTGENAEGFVEEALEGGTYAVRFFVSGGKDFLVFLDGRELSDPEYYRIEPPAQKHAVGVKVVSILGEEWPLYDRNPNDPPPKPGTVGIIEEVSHMADGSHFFRVSFEDGITTHLTEDDLADPARYRIGNQGGADRNQGVADRNTAQSVAISVTAFPVDGKQALPAEAAGSAFISPEAVGTVKSAIPFTDGSHAYAVVFPQGAVKILLDADMDDAERFKVGAETHKYPLGTKLLSIQGEWTDHGEGGEKDQFTGPDAVGVVVERRQAGEWYAVKFQPHDVVIEMADYELEEAETSRCTFYKIGHEAVPPSPHFLLTSTEGSNIHSDALPGYARIRLDAQGAALLSSVAATARELDPALQIASAPAGHGIAVDWLETVDRTTAVLQEGMIIQASVARRFSVLDDDDTYFEENLRDPRVESDGSGFWVRAWVGDEDFIRSAPFAVNDAPYLRDAMKKAAGEGKSTPALFSSIAVEARPALVVDDYGDLMEVGSRPCWKKEQKEEDEDIDGPRM